MVKSTRLKKLLACNEMTFFIEAHNALSAKIAEKNGFQALWASGFAISATLGLPDRNIAAWSQILDIIEYMVDATTVPILMDGDTGFGNVNNVYHIVKKASQKGIAGICFEDKLFPKKNSFLSGEQPLISVDEFSGKIRAACDAKIDDDFCIVARTETLISGLSIEEALCRSEAYVEAGADAILIHSKSYNADEVISFSKKWSHSCPLVVVPTTYYMTPTSVLEEVGISNVIWANHIVRSVIAAIDRITKKIKRYKSVAEINEEIGSLDDVFNYSGEREARLVESKYYKNDRSDEI